MSQVLVSSSEIREADKVAHLVQAFATKPDDLHCLQIPLGGRWGLALPKAENLPIKPKQASDMGILGKCLDLTYCFVP